MKRLILLVLISVVAIGYWCYWRQNEQIRTAYCGGWAAAMVIEYLREHPKDSPSSWDELLPYYDKISIARGRPFLPTEIIARVRIDWDSLKNRLKGDHIHREYIFSIPTGGRWFTRSDPNELIEEYLADNSR